MRNSCSGFNEPTKQDLLLASVNQKAHYTAPKAEYWPLLIVYQYHGQSLKTDDIWGQIYLLECPRPIVRHQVCN